MTAFTLRHQSPTISPLTPLDYLLDGALFGEQIKVTVDHGRRQPQTRGEGAAAGGPCSEIACRTRVRAPTLRSGVGPVRTVRNATVDD